MIEKDTVRLLRECDAGVKMGISSINEVLKYAKSGQLREILNDCKNTHTDLEAEITNELTRYGDDGKSPNPIARGMSYMKTEAKLMMNDSDKTVADLMTDGCNMGVKSLSKYLNQYKAADEKSKDIAKRLISSEEELAKSVRGYL